MNESGAFNPPANNHAQSGYRSAKITQIWSTECYLLWEQPLLPSQGEWSDGANYPDKEGLGNPHGLGGLILELNGSAQWIKTNYYNTLSVKPANGAGPNLLWWNPNSTTGNGV
jgi:hypothetical protein